MLKPIFRSFLFTAAIALLFSACKKEVKENCEGQICTLEFKTIDVSVLDSNQNAIALDSFKVIEISTKAIVTPSNTGLSMEYYQKEGRYPLVTDGMIEVGKTREMEFKGYIDSTLVIQKIYSAKEGCCGVEFVSGNLNVVVQ